METKPENLDITYQIFDGKIVFDPILLNRKDEFSIKLFISNYTGELIPDCRISGIKEIKNKPNKPNVFYWNFYRSYIFLYGLF